MTTTNEQVKARLQAHFGQSFKILSVSDRLVEILDWMHDHPGKTYADYLEATK